MLPRQPFTACTIRNVGSRYEHAEEYAVRIVLTSFGTTGDIQPFLALAVELRRHQHDPILALSPNHAPRVTALGLPFVPIGPDLRDVQRDLVKSEAEDASNVQKLYSLLDHRVARSVSRLV
jgi:UDP:flavonoid glycosyltransferase YjiC (YdhE family)